MILNWDEQADIKLMLKLTIIKFVHRKFSENYCAITDQWCDVNQDEVKELRPIDTR